MSVAPDVFITPWEMVEGFLAGDDADTVVGFFDTVEEHYVRGSAPATQPMLVS